MSTGTSPVGIALGGGMAHGLAHIGVLKAIEENGIIPEIIAGTSIGAVIGALYAGGFSPREIEKIAVSTDWMKVALISDITLQRSGVIRGNRLTELLKSILGNTTFANLKRRFACVATDLYSGEAVVFKSGSLLEAIRASISIPGIFTPVAIGGRYLVDGGLVNEVPVGVCREMGAGFVIGVNIIPNPAKSLNSSLAQTGSPERDEKTRDPSTNLPGQTLTLRFKDIGEAVKAFTRRLQGKKARTTGATSGTRAGKSVKPGLQSPSIFDILSQSIGITGYQLAVENLKEADLAISPEVEKLGFWQFERAAEAILAGENAAREALESGAWKIMLSKRG